MVQIRTLQPERAYEQIHLLKKEQLKALKALKYFQERDYAHKPYVAAATRRWETLGKMIDVYKRAIQ